MDGTHKHQVPDEVGGITEDPAYAVIKGGKSDRSNEKWVQAVSLERDKSFTRMIDNVIKTRNLCGGTVADRWARGGTCPERN